MRNLLLSNGILILTLAVPTLRAQTCFELDVKVSVDGTSTVQRSKLARACFINRFGLKLCTVGGVSVDLLA